MDPQSLDAAVQNMLLGLFPPFDVTAPTVLSQLFRVLEARYHGDGFCCLLDFLIPSKRLLEHVRQTACAPYSSCIFLHEGWPLCLHEKVVVHLGPLNPLLLRPGDFYLQAEPCGEQSASLVVKCLSKDLTTVENIPIPEASCAFLFTRDWLEEINRDLDRPALRTCLVATGNGIVPIPWGKIATPEFVQVPEIESSEQRESSSSPEIYDKTKSQPQDGKTVIFDDGRSSPGGSSRATWSKYPGLIKVEEGSWRRSSLFVVPSLCDIISENLEGEYVNLLGFSEEKKADCSPAKSKTPSLAEHHPSHHREVSPRAKKGLVCVNRDGGVTVENWGCGKGPNSEEGPCTPCLRRKLNPDPQVLEPRCRYRESYVAALKNPVNFSSGLMAAILEEIDVARPVVHMENTDAKPPEGLDQLDPRTHLGHPKKGRKVEEASKQGHPKLLKSPAESPVAGHKFSFLKGHRHSASTGSGPPGPEKAGRGQEGPRKKMLSVPSARMSHAKPAVGKGNPEGKQVESPGTSQVDALVSEHPTLKITDGAPGSVPSTDGPLLKDLLPPASDSWEPLQWESLDPALVSSGALCLPGNVDKAGRPIIQITTRHRVWQGPSGSAPEAAQLLLYFCNLSRKRSHPVGLTFLIDARKDPPSPSLFTALRATQKALLNCAPTVLLLAEKEVASHLEKLPSLQVEVLSSLKALGRHVDSSQLTSALEGQFPYCHIEWVQYFQKWHPFFRDLTEASGLLQSTTRELENEKALETLQAVEEQVGRHRQLMQEVLCDVQLTRLQREGGATLARLRKEAARLSFCPDVRNSIERALALYSLVEDEVHNLVAKSNSRLEHLEFLLKVKQLESEFLKLSLWFDEEGEPELCGVRATEGSRESTEESYRRFKEFFREATVHYNRGLSLSKEAAKVQGSRYPEIEAFEAAKRTFQAKLTTFYMEMQMTEAKLETFLDLYRFCDKVTQFNLDCKQRQALWASRKNEPMAIDLQEDVEKLLQQLSGEFSPEKFQQMKVQTSCMCNESGLAMWREALERLQEARQILEDALARLKKDHMENSRLNPAPKVPLEHLCLDGRSVQTKPGEEILESHHSRSEVRSVKSIGNHSSSSLEDSLCCGLDDKDVKGGEQTYLASLGANVETGTSETLESLHMNAKLSPSPPAEPVSSPATRQVPRAFETLPSSKQSCTTVPARGGSSQRKETAQYFQLSRHESFSSEDTDSQHSVEEALASSAPLPVDSRGTKGGWAPDKAAGIIYLENHNPIRLPNAAAQ